MSDGGFESGMAGGLSFGDAARVAHDRWVASGHCAEINWAKTWCNGEAGHYGDHWAPYENPDGGVTYVEWG